MNLQKSYLTLIPIAAIGLMIHPAPANAQNGLILSDQFFGTDVEEGVGSWTTPDGLVTIMDTGGDFGTGGAERELSFVGNAGGSLASAWDHEDNEGMSLTFNDPDAGLLQIGARWSRASATISGFLFDPEASVQGDVAASATWDELTETLTIDMNWTGSNIFLFDFANVEASAGQTLVFDFDQDTFTNDDGYQFALNTVGYGVIPEPGTYALFAGLIALAGTGLIRRLRKRNT